MLCVMALESRQRRYCGIRYWAHSTGHRNTLIMEVFMGRLAGWMQKLTGRGAMRSPGAPSLRRLVERQFWEQIATGMTSERAAEVVGVSQAVGTRWWRQAIVYVETCVRKIFVVCGARRNRSATSPRRWCAGARAPHWAKPFYGLTRADTQRCNSWRQARVSGICFAVEGRACGQKAQAGETGD
jgi:hypothetical protein